MCEWRPDFEKLNTRVDGIESRLSQVEHDVAKMRSESQDGFKEINSFLSNLAHEFGERMDNIDKRLVEEKEKWGNTLRTIVTWTVKVVLAGCLAAMGLTAYKMIFGS